MSDDAVAGCRGESVVEQLDFDCISSHFFVTCVVGILFVRLLSVFCSV